MTGATKSQPRIPAEEPTDRCKVFIPRSTWGPDATTEDGCLAGMGARGLELLGSVLLWICDS